MALEPGSKMSQSELQRIAAIYNATQPAIHDSTKGGFPGLEASFLQGKQKFSSNPPRGAAPQPSGAYTRYENRLAGPLLEAFKGGLSPTDHAINSGLLPQSARSLEYKLNQGTASQPFNVSKTAPPKDSWQAAALASQNQPASSSSPSAPASPYQNGGSAGAGAGGSGISIPNFQLSSTGKLQAPSMGGFEGSFDISDFLSDFESKVAGIGNDPNREEGYKERANEMAGLEYDSSISQVRRAIEEIGKQLGIGTNALNMHAKSGDAQLEGVAAELNSMLTQNQDKVSGLFDAAKSDTAALAERSRNAVNGIMGEGAQGITNDLEALGLGDAVNDGLAPAQAAQGQAIQRIEAEEATALQEFTTMNSAFMSHAINDTSIASKEFAGRRAQFATEVAGSLGDLQNTAMQAISQGQFELGAMLKERGQMVNVLYQDLIEKGESKDRQLYQDALSEFLAMANLEAQSVQSELSIHNANQQAMQQNFDNEFSLQQYADNLKQQDFQNSLASRSASGGGGGRGSGGSGGGDDANMLLQYFLEQGYPFEQAYVLANDQVARRGEFMGNGELTGNKDIDAMYNIAGPDMFPKLQGIYTNPDVRNALDPLVAGIESTKTTGGVGVSPALANMLNDPNFKGDQRTRLEALLARQNQQNAGNLSKAELALAASGLGG